MTTGYQCRCSAECHQPASRQGGACAGHERAERIQSMLQSPNWRTRATARAWLLIAPPPDTADREPEAG
jgi:hypothetical protein